MMTVKKLLVSFLAGALLIGTGIGVTVLELSRWDTADYPRYLEKEPVKTEEISEEFDIEDYEKISVYTAGQASRFRNEKMVEIVEDKTCTDNIVVVVDYKGKLPYTDIYSYETTDHSSQQDYLCMDIIVQPDYNYSLSEIRQIVEEMFESKVFYRNNLNTLIEKVTIYTANPDKFVVKGY